ncbi:MAG: endopeptidase La [Planctomycetota bacterium]
MDPKQDDTREVPTKVDAPALELSSSVVFPNDVVSIQISDNDPALDLLRDFEDETMVAIVFSTGRAYPPRRRTDLHPVCVLARVVQCVDLPDGAMQAVFHGLSRARVLGVKQVDGRSIIRTETLTIEDPPATDTNARILKILDLVGEYAPRDGSYPEDLENILRLNVRGFGRFADLVAAYLHLPLSIKRDMVLAVDPEARLDILADAIRGELERNTLEEEMHGQVRQQIEERQKEQYLRQQLRAIRRELGEEGSGEEEIEELRARLSKSGMPAETLETAERELRRLGAVPSSSAEYHVILSYVNWLLDMPWKKRTRDRYDIEAARAVLEEQHSGLEKVKERMIEFLAVRKLKNDKSAPVICLVGPPGVGKTTLGRSVARAMGRKFERMSVGGLRDEAEIKGHRRTYVGAMPGKIVQLMKRSGVKNPVIQIDEIDKMGSDARGDPAAAVLEVLDPEVNNEFRDYYLDVGVDLSEAIFIVTANVVDTIPAALRDRLEILRIGGYTRSEKLTIGRRHLVPRALDAHGLDAETLRFTTPGLELLIDGHTREAGLREFERAISAVCRKIAVRVVEGREVATRVGRPLVRELLGPAPFKVETGLKQPEVGVATGLAWTAAGGALLLIEANRMPGRGEVKVTGRLGEVMQESVSAALSYIRANADEFNIEPSTFKENDLHIHFPDGATPKDGPSAGVAIATCLASLLTDRAIRHDVAMTGEITLKGKVLEVGGIKEKLIAAHRCGIRRVLIPAANLKDLEEVPAEVRERLDIVATTEVMTNICEAMIGRPGAKNSKSMPIEAVEPPAVRAKA